MLGVRFLNHCFWADTKILLVKSGWGLQEMVIDSTWAILESGVYMEAVIARSNVGMESARSSG